MKIILFNDTDIMKWPLKVNKISEKTKALPLKDIKNLPDN